MTTKKTDLDREYLGAEHLKAAKLLELAMKAQTESIFNVILEAYECGYKNGSKHRGTNSKNN